MPSKSERTQNVKRTPGSCPVKPFIAWAVRVCLTCVVMMMAGHRLAPAVAARVHADGAALVSGAKKATLHTPAPGKPERQARSLDEGTRCEPEPSELGALEDDSAEWFLCTRHVQSILDHDDQTLRAKSIAPDAQRLTTASCPRGPPRA